MLCSLRVVFVAGLCGVALDQMQQGGLTWEDLGIVLEAPPDSTACASTNRFVLGGVGDVSAMLATQRARFFVTGRSDHYIEFQR